MKAIKWLGDSLDVLRSLSPDVRSRAGFELRRVQQGQEPTDWKPMPGIGLGVKEIRINIGTAHRVFYVARFSEAIYVLHVMTKKTQKTPKREMDVAAARFRKMANER